MNLDSIYGNLSAKRPLSYSAKLVRLDTVRDGLIIVCSICDLDWSLCYYDLQTSKSIRMPRSRSVVLLQA